MWNVRKFIAHFISLQARVKAGEGKGDLRKVSKLVEFSSTIITNDYCIIFHQLCKVGIL